VLCSLEFAQLRVFVFLPANLRCMQGLHLTVYVSRVEIQRHPAEQDDINKKAEKLTINHVIIIVYNF